MSSGMMERSRSPRIRAGRTADTSTDHAAGGTADLAADHLAAGCANAATDGGFGAIAFVGTVKWRESDLLDGSDIAELTRASAAVSGANSATRLVAVSRAGFARRIAAPTRKLEPDEILEAFPAD